MDDGSTVTARVVGAAARAAVADVGELVEKYTLLEALRRADPGRTPARRDAMRAIAVRFPGALREWDQATLDELARRREAAERAHALLNRAGADGLAHLDAPEQAWLLLSMRVHESMRCALAAKRLLAGRPVSDELFAVVHAALGVDRQRLEAIATPPSGRVSELVYGEVARAEGMSVAALKARLFPAGAAPALGAKP